MAGTLYLGRNKVCPAILIGEGKSPLDIFTVDDEGYLRQSNVLDGTGIKHIDSDSFSNCGFYIVHFGDTTLTELNFPDLESLSSLDLKNIPTLEKAYFPKLREGQISFAMDESLTSYNLDSVVDTRNFNNGDDFYYVFGYCSSLTTASFPNLTTVGQNGFVACFTYCTSLSSCRFPKAEIFYANEGGPRGDTYPFEYCFEGCTSLTDVYFDSVKSTSFSEISYPNWTFTYMLYGVNGCTVHFPSNMESIMGSWSDVLSGFDGTNITVLFDLPATE